MLKHAYLIMAHNQWAILAKLIRLLDDENNDIYLHIDKKVKSFPKDSIIASVSKSRLFFTKRYDIRWGGSKMMECELNMLAEASNRNYDYYHLLSGVDLPLYNVKYIQEFFEENKGKEFVSFDWEGINKGIFLSRTNYYHFFSKYLGRGNQIDLKSRLLSRLNRYSLRLQRLLRINRNRNIDIYKGSQWFSITKELTYALIKKKEGLIKRYRWTLNADEEFIQNFIMNQGMEKRCIDNDLRYIVWKGNSPSPETLTYADYDRMINSGCLFARKFSYDVDEKIINKIYISLYNS